MGLSAKLDHYLIFGSGLVLTRPLPENKWPKSPVAGATGLSVKLKLDAGLIQLLASEAVEAERKQREHHHR